MSLSGQFARAAASAVTQDLERNVSQAIGKPLGGLTGVPPRAPGHSEINWVDFNYPPLLRLIHYNLDELPSTLTGMVRCFIVSFKLTTFSCILNLIDNIIIVLSLKAPGRWLIQSALHLLLLPAAALGVFYSGYRGLAEPDSTLAFRFKVGQPLLAAVYLLMAVAPWGSINGFAQLEDTEGSVVWTVMIIVESIIWALNFALACWNTVRAQKYDIYGIGLPTTGGSRF